MKGSSIDGRGHRGNAERRRKQKAAAVATAAAKLPRPTKAVDLRPASPPKTSPWRPTWHVELKAADFPPLTELKLHTSSKRKPKRTQETNLQPPIPSPPTPSSPEARTYSKAGETLETASTTSTSTSSRKLFEDAAPRAGEMLWEHPFGADVLVHAESTIFKIHRNMIQPQSGWFQDHLPPPNLDGRPVAVHLPHPAGAVACCLRYTYTHRIEICEHDGLHVLNIVHIPRCALCYLAAVRLRIDKMAWQLVKIIEHTAIELGDYLKTKPSDFRLNTREFVAFALHLQNTLEIAYGAPDQNLMRPIRMALASFLDASIMFVLQHSQSAQLTSSEPWTRYASLIWADQIEYRRSLGQSHPLKGSTVPDQKTLVMLMERHTLDEAGNCVAEAEVPQHTSLAKTKTNENRQQETALNESG